MLLTRALFSGGFLLMLLTKALFSGGFLLMLLKFKFNNAG